MTDNVAPMRAGLRVIVRLSLFAAAGILAAAVIVGCSTLDTAMALTMGNGGSSQPAKQADTSPSAPGTSGASAMAYQQQFGAFYRGFWSFGWFGYQDSNYQAGQGSVWQIASTGDNSSKPVTFERALLKTNADASQWWRFKVVTSDATIIYEFLINGDGVVKKVRLRDPKSGTIYQFVPNQSASPNAASTPTREQIQNTYVGTDTVTVLAGTFTAAHYAYADPQSGYKTDMWTDKKVPGYMVKFTATNSNNQESSTGQLVQIETGVTTTLQSY